MRATLGDKWEQLFDLNIANCNKPKFFSEHEHPFYSVDTEAKDLKGAAITSGKDLQENQYYLEGNARLVTEFYQKLLGRDEVRVCYFGDHFWSDVHAASAHIPAEGNPKWDAIAVIEELYWHDKWACEGKEAHLNDNSSIWGKNFFFDKVGNKQVKNYFVAEVEKVARYALPFLKNINRFISSTQSRNAPVTTAGSSKKKVAKAKKDFSKKMAGSKKIVKKPPGRKLVKNVTKCLKKFGRKSNK